jgi:hypothetical protein
MEQIENIKWTPIPDYDGYFLSEDGLVLSRKNKIPYILKQRTNNNNDKNQPSIVTLRADGSKPKTFLLSFLMATAFIENPNKYTLIKFKDGNKLNYHLDNIEWSDNPFESKDIWEIVKNYPGYEICENGVRNIKTKKILKPQIDINGYPLTQLRNTNKERKNIGIHILIARQYIPNPFNLPEVNHINGNKMNYSISNLEWVTGSQNSQHAHDNKLNKGTLGKGKHVELLDENYQVIKTFTSIRSAGVFLDKSGDALKWHFRNNILIDGTVLINQHRIRLKIHNDIDGEIWKNVNTENNYINNHYSVSNYARVKNINTGVILLPDSVRKYHRVTLPNNINKWGSKFFVHRLVAFAFQSYKGKQSDYDVNHIDKNPSNNKESNLEIIKHKEHLIKDQGIPVLGLDEDNKYIIFNSYSSARDFIKKTTYGIKSSMSRNGICGGYKWFVLDSPEAREIIANDNYELIQ